MDNTDFTCYLKYQFRFAFPSCSKLNEFTVEIIINFSFLVNKLTVVRRIGTTIKFKLHNFGAPIFGGGQFAKRQSFVNRLWHG